MTTMSHDPQRPFWPPLRHLSVCLPDRMPSNLTQHQASAGELAAGSRFRVTMKASSGQSRILHEQARRCLGRCFIL
jgi:hypothetical protein